MEMLKINQKCSFIDSDTNKLIFGIVIKIDTKKGIMKIKDSSGNIHYLGY